MAIYSPFRWFNSKLLAWLLLVESVVGFGFFLLSILACR
jgi:hypothetical protein